ncbi:MAG TPA: response regulator transcription factor [Acidimicrobiales bacterium]
MRVLVVEDDEQLADVIVRSLRRDAFAVDAAADGAVALEKARTTDYDVIVLDRDLPGVHGDVVCRQLVADRLPARIIMLTAAAAVEDRVEGLLLGADDYLTKPFAMAELTARLRALSRRTERPRPPRLTWRDVWLDTASRTAGRCDRPLHLTNREFAVLEELMLEPGRVVSAEELMERVWDDRLDPFSNAVRVTILTLRRKLGDPPVISTVVGQGYRLG